MTLPTAPHRADQDARALRERFELAVLGDDDRVCAEAARALFWFCSEHPEYSMCALVPESLPATPDEAVRIASKYESRCKGCSTFIAIDDECFYTPGEKGVSCLNCGGRR